MGRLPPFVLGSTQLLHHFLGSKKVAKNRNVRYHVLDFMLGLQRGDGAKKEIEASRTSKTGMIEHEGT